MFLPNQTKASYAIELNILVLKRHQRQTVSTLSLRNVIPLSQKLFIFDQSMWIKNKPD